MTKITWGEEIAVNGVRPPWLLDDDLIQWAEADKNEWYPRHGHQARRYVQADYDENIRFIRLPAGHWAYEPLRRGFTPWAGGEKGPSDCVDEVLYRDGSAGRLTEPSCWKHFDYPSDIIGYKPRPAAATEQPPQWALDKAEQVLSRAVHNRYVTEVVARYIMQHEQPPVTVDPDVEAVRKILAEWEDDHIDMIAGIWDEHPTFQAALAEYRKWKVKEA